MPSEGERRGFVRCGIHGGGTGGLVEILRVSPDTCALLKRPYILINAGETPDPIVAAERIVKFIEIDGIQVLNVAGPRLSGWPGGYAFALKVMGQVIEKAADLAS
jgi:Circularly permutated YpsA SLOG family